jgi:putative transposase
VTTGTAGCELSPEQAAAAAMAAEAKKRGLEVTSPDGLLKLFTKSVLETARNEEMTDHLGHKNNEPQIAKKRRRQLADLDEVVLSLYTKRLTTREISAHFDQILWCVDFEGDHLPDHR